MRTQTIQDPLAPIGALAESDGWVLLLGVKHTSNTSIHYAEKEAGRKQLIYWALTPAGVVECPNCPGCSEGFQAIEERLDKIIRTVQVGPGRIQAMPLKDLLNIAYQWIQEDPLALLCDREDCEVCNAVREAVAAG